MKTTDTQTRKRKNKGSLSVFDEFTESEGAGSILFKPTLEQESLRKIEERTKSADLPVGARLEKAQVPSDKASTAQALQKPLPEDFLQILNEVEKDSSSMWSKAADRNLVQTSFKPSSESSSNIVQTGFKPSSEIKPKKAKPSSKPGSESSSNIVQTGFKPSSEFQFHKLSPIQQKLLLYLVNQNQVERSEISPPLNGPLLANHLECGLEGLRTAVKRLVQQGLLRIADVKAGRTGWTKYQIPDVAFQTIILNKTWFNSSSNLVQTGFKPSPKPGSEPGSNVPSSSSVLNINKITTTSEAVENEVWSKVEFSAIADIGFTETHVRQVVSQKILTPQQVQDSIDYFAFDIRENGKLKTIKGNVLNFFIGILRRGNSYAAPENYESERDRSHRLYVAQKKKERENREKLDAEIFEIEFEEWVDTLTQEMRDKIVPPSGLMKTGSPAQGAMLKQYFRDKVWPEKQEQVLRGKL